MSLFGTADIDGMVEMFLAVLNDALKGNGFAIFLIVGVVLAIVYILCLIGIILCIVFDKPAITSGRIVDKSRNRRYAYAFVNGIVIPILPHWDHYLHIQDVIEGQVKQASIVVSSKFYNEHKVGDWVDLKQFT